MTTQSRSRTIDPKPSSASGGIRDVGADRGPVCVSVLLPVFNAETTLRTALTSVLDQSFADLEAVVIDDGSDDSSSRIVADIASEDSRVRLFKQSHQGVTAALQAGLRNCRGKYIARMDADDIAMPERFAKQVAYLEAHRDVVVLGGAARLSVPGRSLITTIDPPLTHDALVWALKSGSPFVHSTVVMRRETLVQVGGYRAAFRFSQDYDLWLRLAEIGRLANLSDIVLEYRVSPEQIATKHLEGSFLSSLGARTCAAFRQAGRPDPSPQSDIIDRAWLLEHGWAELDIDRALVDTYADRVWWLVGLGMLDAAERLVEDLSRLRVTPAMARSHRFRWRWESTRIAWRSGDRSRAVARLVSVCARSPWMTSKRLAGYLARQLRAGPREHAQDPRTEPRA